MLTVIHQCHPALDTVAESELAGSACFQAAHRKLLLLDNVAVLQCALVINIGSISQA